MQDEKGARVRFPPPLVFAGGLVVGIVTNRLIPLPTHLDRAIALALAIGTLAVALALGVPAIGLFRQTGQSPRPWTPTPSLVFNGPYRFTRNPMYVGMTLLTASIGLWLDNVWVLMFAFVALAIVHFIAVLPEEAYLSDKFGEPYRRYLTTVRRYI